MEPLVLTTTALAAGHHAISLLKTITGTLKKAGKPEALNDLIELQVVMSELLQKQQEIIRENGVLYDRVKELEASWNLREKIIRKGNALYLKSDEKHERPYCMACWGHDHKLIDLLILRMHDGISFKCHICSKR
jgi:hypothetical protein